MADNRQHRRSPVTGKRLLYFCIYVAIYVALRFHGEIVYQQVAVPGGHGGVEVYRMISAKPDAPYWQQQVWRAFFSLAMVAEEEGRPFYEKARQMYGQSQGGGRGGNRGGQAQQPAPSGQNTFSGNSGRGASARPPRASGRAAGSGNGLQEGERMIYDPRKGGPMPSLR